MKNFLKQVISSVAAVTMAVTIMGGVGSSTVFAEDATSYTNGTATYNANVDTTTNAKITITLPSKQDSTSTNEPESNTTYTYKVYKVFDAVSGQGSTAGANDANVSYSIMSGKKNSTGTTNAERAGFTDANGMATYFTVDNAGNVSATDAATVGGTGPDKDNLKQEAADAIWKYIGSDTPVTTVTVKAVNDGTATEKLEISGLAYGYYYITTTTGSVVTVNTTHPNADVIDKNSVPTVDKKIASVEDNLGSVDSNGKNAIAQVGKKLNYEATITIGKGAENYVFHDKMGENLAYVAGSVKIYKNDSITEEANTSNANWEVVESGTGLNGDTFQVHFKDSYIKILTPGDKLVVKYQATVTSDALQTTPANNEAKISWGDPSDTHTSKESKTNVYNAKISVVKHITEDGTTDTNKGLAGAGFVLSKTVDKTTSYYKYTAAKAAEGDTPAAPASIEWVSDIDQATEYMSDSTGKLYPTKTENGKTVADTSKPEAAFVGLSDGAYVLVEKTVPDGYTAVDPDKDALKITINAANVGNALEATNLEKSATVLNKAGSTLPSTGGIGTTIFYVIGGVLIAGAAILLITRRKKA